MQDNRRGCSSVGRASALQADGRRFESGRLHHPVAARAVEEAEQWRTRPRARPFFENEVDRERGKSRVQKAWLS